MGEWRITLIRAKGHYLGRVEAPDAEAAIERAITEFNIDEAHRSRLIAQRWSEPSTAQYGSIEKRAHRAAVGSAVAVAAIVAARITCLARPAA